MNLRAPNPLLRPLGLLLTLLVSVAMVVAPALALATNDVELREVEDGEEKEHEKDAEARESVRDGAPRERVSRSPDRQRSAGGSSPTGCASRVGTPAPDVWLAPRRC